MTFLSRLQSEAEFTQTCSAMIAEMIDTVPSNVALTDEIALLPVTGQSLECIYKRCQGLFVLLDFPESNYPFEHPNSFH